MIVSTPDLDGVTGHAADMYDSDLSGDGFVFAYTRAMAVNPDAHQAFETLDPVRSCLRSAYATTSSPHWARRAIGSEHCLLAHGRRSLRAGLFDEDQLARLARDGVEADLDERDRAVVAYSEKLSTDAAAMTDADSGRLREVGFTDREIVDITLAAAARNFFSRALLALAVPVDDAGAHPGASSRRCAHRATQRGQWWDDRLQQDEHPAERGGDHGAENARSQCSSSAPPRSTPARRGARC